MADTYAERNNIGYKSDAKRITELQDMEKMNEMFFVKPVLKLPKNRLGALSQYKKIETLEPHQQVHELVNSEILTAANTNHENSDFRNMLAEKIATQASALGMTVEEYANGVSSS